MWHKSWSLEDREELAKMWAAGLPGDKIARYFGVSRNAVYGQVKQLNLKNRPRGGSYPRRSTIGDKNDE